jgi:hypothetical protein
MGTTGVLEGYLGDTWWAMGYTARIPCPGGDFWYL